MAERSGAGVENVLVVSTWFPHPLDNGSRVRAHHLLRQLSGRYRVTLATFGTSDEASAPGPLDALASRVVVVPPARSASMPLGPRGLLSRVPRHYLQSDSAQMHDTVRHLLPGQDVAVALQVDAARYLAGHDGIPKVFDEVEVTVFREQYERARRLLRVRHGLTWWKFRRFTASLVDAFDQSTAVSAKERDEIIGIGCDPDRVSVVPNGVSVDLAGEPAMRVPRLVYPGSVLFAANLDAVRYFVRDVLPRLRERRPDLELVVTGATGGVDITELMRPGVRFTGRLDDVEPFVAESAVCVVPLRIGGGTRLKVLQAMALGTPVVSTTKGIEGLDVAADRHVLVADEPGAFATAVMRLLDDDALHRRISDEARTLMSDRYGWRTIADSLDAVIHRAVDRHRRRGDAAPRLG
ncbi:MAG: glycosyltransferase family 4 protein [Vicinamibacterales bacterium]